MDHMDRRRLLYSLAATAVGLGVRPACANTEPSTPPNRRDHIGELYQVRDSWFIARSADQPRGRHASDFWSMPFCDIDRLPHLPRQIARGMMWYFSGQPLTAHQRDLASYFPRLCDSPCCYISHFNGTNSLSSAIRILIDHDSIATRNHTAIVALDSLGPAPGEPEWARILPQLARCYDRVIGLYHLERRGLRQWQHSVDAVFPMEEGETYSKRHFWNAALHCNTVIVTSSGLIETDPGVSPTATTETLAGELAGQLAYALLDEVLCERVSVGVAGPAKKHKPRFYALGRVTFGIAPTERQVLAERWRPNAGSYAAASVHHLATMCRSWWQQPQREQRKLA